MRKVKFSDLPSDTLLVIRGNQNRILVAGLILEPEICRYVLLPMHTSNSLWNICCVLGLDTIHCI